MKKITPVLLPLALLAVALAGCSKSTKPTSPSSSDRAAVDMAQASDAMASHPEYVNDDVFADPTSTVFASARPAAALDEEPGTWFRPMRWWRTIDSTTHHVDIAFSDPDSSGRPTNALATITRELFGKFHVVVKDSTAPDSLVRLVVKPLDDHWTRKVALHRFIERDWDDQDHDGDTTEVESHWRVVGTSGVLVTSAGATVHIESVRIQAGTLDTTITDPLALHRLRRFELFRAFTLVHLTVKTDRNDDIVAFYRMGDRRIFTNNGDDTYSIDFMAWDFGGLRHLGVNAFSNGTITSLTDPYDSQAWLVPHVARDADDLVASH
jgi:hypothetical protein